MAGRKYASDYRLEKHVSPDGKMESTPVYQGAWFTFVQPADQIRRLRKTLLTGCAAVLLLLLPMLFDNTRLGRTVYVVLPAVLSLVPVYLLLASARRLGFPEDPFTREHRDKTDKRIRGGAVALTVCLAVSCVGSLVHFILKGIAVNEIFCVVCLFLALAVSVVLLTRRNRAETKQTEKF